MEPLTLYDTQPGPAEALEREAQRRGKSVAETATELLIEEFECKTADLPRIDPDDWEGIADPPTQCLEHGALLLSRAAHFEHVEGSASSVCSQQAESSEKRPFTPYWPPRMGV